MKLLLVAKVSNRKKKASQVILGWGFAHNEFPLHTQKKLKKQWGCERK